MSKYYCIIYVCVIHTHTHTHTHIYMYHTISSLSIHLLMYLQVASVAWLLGIMLQWTLLCIWIFFKLVFLIFSDKYLWLEMLDHMVLLFLTFWENFIKLSIVLAPSYDPISSVQVFPYLHILAKISCFLSFW